MAEKKMFYGAQPFQFEKARFMRKNLTKAERILWEHLRKNQILGLRFRCQHPIASYVADFYCHKVQLVIEVDGKSHNRREQMLTDSIRSYNMKCLSLTILRYTDRQVEEKLDEVIRSIREEVKRLLNEKKKKQLEYNKRTRKITVT